MSNVNEALEIFFLFKRINSKNIHVRVVFLYLFVKLKIESKGISIPSLSLFRNILFQDFINNFINFIKELISNLGIVLTFSRKISARPVEDNGIPGVFEFFEKFQGLEVKNTEKFQRVDGLKVLMEFQGKEDKKTMKNYRGC